MAHESGWIVNLKKGPFMSAWIKMISDKDADAPLK